ncbi:Probable ATP-dependent DNA helicase HFM1 [Eumeta japonica]|uniref:DNA 3'-5' helicase n=1 Tax=Eumeta variegata TaxID=151549 RepID=A0A4C1XEC5_EUMVA|nr:Probable ATP-dependent DNA helicase HFM1 [Eumeta japonica]
MLHRYQALIEGTEPLESFLHHRLAENLNSEVALRTISDLVQSVQWVKSTFFYVRAARNPRKYLGLPHDAPQQQITYKIEELCNIAMNRLVSAGFVTMDEACCVQSTNVGHLMSVYYLDFETMKHFMKIEGSESLEKLLWVVCESHELADMHLRVDERRCLNALNKSNTAATIRFPMKGKINSRQMKLNCIIQAVLGCLNIPDPSLNQEAMKIMRVAERVCKGMVAYVTGNELLASTPCFFTTVVNAVLLTKCITAHLWENSPYMTRQLKGIGPAFSTLLAAAGKNNFSLIEESHPRDLERIMNKGPPAGNLLKKQVSLFPKYQLTVTPIDTKIVSIQLQLLNYLLLSENMDNLTAGENHKFYIVVGDSENNLLLLTTFNGVVQKSQLYENCNNEKNQENKEEKNKSIVDEPYEDHYYKNASDNYWDPVPTYGERSFKDAFGTTPEYVMMGIPRENLINGSLRSDPQFIADSKTIGVNGENVPEVALNDKYVVSIRVPTLGIWAVADVFLLQIPLRIFNSGGTPINIESGTKEINVKKNQTKSATKRPFNISDIYRATNTLPDNFIHGKALRSCEPCVFYESLDRVQENDNEYVTKIKQRDIGESNDDDTVESVESIVDLEKLDNRLPDNMMDQILLNPMKLLQYHKTSNDDEVIIPPPLEFSDNFETLNANSNYESDDEKNTFYDNVYSPLNKQGIFQNIDIDSYNQEHFDSENRSDISSRSENLFLELKPTQEVETWTSSSKDEPLHFYSNQTLLTPHEMCSTPAQRINSLADIEIKKGFPRTDTSNSRYNGNNSTKCSLKEYCFGKEKMKKRT